MSTATIITVKVDNGHTIDWMDIDLPIPMDSYEVKPYGAEYWNDKEERTPYEIQYAISGNFGTGEGRKYLHDTASKIAYALNGKYEISQIPFGPVKTYRLEIFNHLEKVPTFYRELESNAWNGSRNEIFNAMRIKAYQMFKTGTLNLEALREYGNNISNNSEHVKYLAPNIYQWTEENYTGRQSIMSRPEAGLNASKTKSDRVRSRIFNALKSNILNVSSLPIATASNILGVSRHTFRKYLFLYRETLRALELYARVSTPYVRLVCPPIEEIRKTLSNIVDWISKGISEVVLGTGFVDTGQVSVRLGRISTTESETISRGMSSRVDIANGSYSHRREFNTKDDR